MEAKDLTGLNAQELNELGNEYADAGRWEEAKACYEKSLALRQEAGDRRGEGLVLNNLGALFHQRGLFSQALSNYEKSLALARELGERESELAVLLNQTLIHFVQGDEEYFLKAVHETETLARELQRWEPLARMKWLQGRWALNSPAEYKIALGHFSETLGYAQREDTETLQDFVEQIGQEIRRLALEGQEGWARVFCDYLVAAGERGSLGDEVVTAITCLRQELLRPQVFSPGKE